MDIENALKATWGRNLWEKPPRFKHNYRDRYTDSFLDSMSSWKLVTICIRLLSLGSWPSSRSFVCRLVRGYGIELLDNSWEGSLARSYEAFLAWEENLSHLFMILLRPSSFSWIFSKISLPQWQKNSLKWSTRSMELCATRFSRLTTTLLQGWWICVLMHFYFLSESAPGMQIVNSYASDPLGFLREFVRLAAHVYQQSSGVGKFLMEKMIFVCFWKKRTIIKHH